MTIKIDDTDVENCKTSLEECCEGGSLSAGCYHDNCTGAVSMKEFNLQDPKTWHCFKEVAATLGKEDAEYELGKVLLQINDGEITSNDLGADLNLLEDSLLYAFPWNETNQGRSFWNNIDDGKKPEGYDSTPDTPPTPEVDKKATPALKELNVEGTMEVRSQTLGELVEAIQANIPPHLGIHFQPDGEVLLECDNAYVAVSELDSEGVDKAIEFVAHYGHLVFGKNVEE